MSLGVATRGRDLITEGQCLCLCNGPWVAAGSVGSLVPDYGCCTHCQRAEGGSGRIDLPGQCTDKGKNMIIILSNRVPNLWIGQICRLAWGGSVWGSCGKTCEGAVKDCEGGPDLTCLCFGSGVVWIEQGWKKAVLKRKACSECHWAPEKPEREEERGTEKREDVSMQEEKW